jgi:hypothetical protein
MPRQARLNEFPNFVPANANIAMGLFVDFMIVNTTAGLSGTGWAFGVGEGLDVTGGTLGYFSFEQLRQARNIIGVVAAGDVLTITFTVGWQVVGVFVGAGIGEVAGAAAGYFNWK